ncbi:hypothetical protein CYMTET_13644 [Cymbomonas tetramitiformis]|uniref:Uncharacterized protein n=1 Tax=Cymbomonas tetramitiformis TaxID=36881 RepID=A0AAE0GI22_9CHLO|nr:hypothetical protein CYMTET_13644 [Cymbomonas tetramitiformis]
MLWTRSVSFTVFYAANDPRLDAVDDLRDSGGKVQPKSSVDREVLSQFMGAGNDVAITARRKGKRPRKALDSLNMEDDPGERGKRGHKRLRGPAVEDDFFAPAEEAAPATDTATASRAALLLSKTAALLQKTAANSKSTQGFPQASARLALTHSSVLGNSTNSSDLPATPKAPVQPKAGTAEFWLSLSKNVYDKTHGKTQADLSGYPATQHGKRYAAESQAEESLFNEDGLPDEEEDDSVDGDTNWKPKPRKQHPPPPKEPAILTFSDVDVDASFSYEAAQEIISKENQQRKNDAAEAKRKCLEAEKGLRKMQLRVYKKEETGGKQRALEERLAQAEKDLTEKCAVVRSALQHSQDEDETRPRSMRETALMHLFTNMQNLTGEALAETWENLNWEDEEARSAGQEMLARLKQSLQVEKNQAASVSDMLSELTANSGSLDVIQAAGLRKHKSRTQSPPPPNVPSKPVRLLPPGLPPGAHYPPPLIENVIASLFPKRVSNRTTSFIAKVVRAERSPPPPSPPPYPPPPQPPPLPGIPFPPPALPEMPPPPPPWWKVIFNSSPPPPDRRSRRSRTRPPPGPSAQPPYPPPLPQQQQDEQALKSLISEQKNQAAHDSLDYVRKEMLMKEKLDLIDQQIWKLNSDELTSEFYNKTSLYNRSDVQGYLEESPPPPLDELQQLKLLKKSAREELLRSMGDLMDTSPPPPDYQQMLTRYDALLNLTSMEDLSRFFNQERLDKELSKEASEEVSGQMEHVYTQIDHFSKLGTLLTREDYPEHMRPSLPMPPPPPPSPPGPPTPKLEVLVQNITIEKTNSLLDSPDKDLDWRQHGHLEKFPKLKEYMKTRAKNKVDKVQNIQSVQHTMVETRSDILRKCKGSDCRTEG